MPKTVLITGATGFVGIHLVRKFLADGYIVKCLVRDHKKLQRQLGKTFFDVLVGVLDLNNPDPKEFNGFDLVIHNAGATKALSLDEFIQVNATGTLNVVNAVLQAGSCKRFVYISSIAAGSPSFVGHREDEKSHPVSDYGRSKYLAENYIVKHLYDVIPYTILRPAAVYGAGDTELIQITKIIKIGLIPSFEFNDNQVSLIYVRDLVNATSYLSTCLGAMDMKINVAYPENLSLREFLEYSASLLKPSARTFKVSNTILRLLIETNKFIGDCYDAPVMMTPSKLKELSSSWAVNTSKLTSLGFEPAYRFKTGWKLTLLGEAN